MGNKSNESSSVFQGWALSHWVNGFIAILVGYTSSAAIIFQAAHVAGANEAETASWMWALGIGMGVSTLALSFYYRLPLLTAWSTPGAALLVVSLQGVPLSEAVAAFIFCGLLITLMGYAGWFERFMHLVPLPIAAAMLAGVLFKFGMDAFLAIQVEPLLVGCMLLTFVFSKPFLPYYAVPLTLVVGVLVAAFDGSLAVDSLKQLQFKLTVPVFIWPEWHWQSLLNIGLPLFIVTMASQNIPAVAVLKTYGHTRVPLSKAIGLTGLVSIVSAPFLGHAYNLAAITLAISMGDLQSDPKKRYFGTASAGVFYLITGIFSSSITALFLAFPKALIVAIAGFALLSTIANSLQTAMNEPSERDAALIVFLVTASGLTVGGLGSAFWGIVIGLIIRAWWLRAQALKHN